MKKPIIIALLTDYGSRDWYAASLKGVLLNQAPRATCVDITHDIPAQDVYAGAFVLAAVAKAFPPKTIFLAVVDPGVGGKRDLLALKEDDRIFLAPDNGLLSFVVKSSRPQLVAIDFRRLDLPAPDNTFHGRDILAPAAARLACGASLASLGRKTSHLVRLASPAPQRRKNLLLGRIVYIDRFGNAVTNLEIPDGHRLDGLVCRYKQHTARMVSSYAAGKRNEIIAVVGSLGLIELAIREASFAEACRAQRGERVALLLAEP